MYPEPQSVFSHGNISMKHHKQDKQVLFCIVFSLEPLLSKVASVPSHGSTRHPPVFISNLREFVSYFWFAILEAQVHVILIPSIRYVLERHGFRGYLDETSTQLEQKKAILVWFGHEVEIGR